MSLTICLYEDEFVSNFYPLTSLRPVYLLRPGMKPLFHRAGEFFPDAHLVLITRDMVAPMVAEEHRKVTINLIKRGDGDILFLNGRIRDFGDLKKLVLESRISTRLVNGDDIVGLLLKSDIIAEIPPVATSTEFMDLYRKAREDIPDFDTTATLFHYCWEIVAETPATITAECAAMKSSWEPSSQSDIQPGAIIINRDDIYLEAGATVRPGAVLDAEKGPVFIGANSRIESQAAVVGPCYIGPNSVILAGHIANSSIGHTCRVGGEVEDSIFHSYVNKYHAGFIGHSYVGSWVNFGAMTTNSDLKNNYSSIRVSVNGKLIDSESIKVGSFIGDHTKFGIGALLNTGISIGVCCNIFGGGLVTDKEVKPFKWGSAGEYADYDLEKGIETIRRSMKRREAELSNSQIALLTAIQKGTPPQDGIIRL